jgi:hypothetical protein
MAAVTKPVYFNVEGDRDLLLFACSLPGFSTWVKDRIRDELRRRTTIDDQQSQPDRESSNPAQAGSEWNRRG